MSTERRQSAGASLRDLVEQRCDLGPSVTLALTLSGEQVDVIARRVADLVGDAGAEPELLTVPEAAEFLRCKPQRVRDLLSQGRLGTIKEGRRTLVSRADLVAHLRKAA